MAAAEKNVDRQASESGKPQAERPVWPERLYQTMRGKISRGVGGLVEFEDRTESPDAETVQVFQRAVPGFDAWKPDWAAIKEFLLSRRPIIETALEPLTIDDLKRESKLAMGTNPSQVLEACTVLNELMEEYRHVAQIIAGDEVLNRGRALSDEAMAARRVQKRRVVNKVKSSAAGKSAFLDKASSQFSVKFINSGRPTLHRSFISSTAHRFRTSNARKIRSLPFLPKQIISSAVAQVRR